MTDLLSFIGVVPAATAPLAPGAAAPAADAFFALLDEVLTQLAVVNSALPIATPPSDVTPDLATGPTPTPAAPEAAKDDAQSTPDDTVDVVAASVARVALGLPTPAPIAPTPAPMDTPLPDRRWVPEAPAPQGVAVGRTGQIPTLPPQAHAVLTTPAGIARRFPTPALLAQPSIADAPPAFDTTQVSRASIGAETPVDMPVTPIRTGDTPTVEAPRATEAGPSSSEPSEPAPPEAAPEMPQPAAPAPQDLAPPASVAALANPPTAPHTVERERERVRGIGAPLRTAVREMPKDKPNSVAVTIRLDPPELGEVKVRVVAHGDRVQITLHADSQEARTALEQRHHDVAELLRQDGFNLDGFDVESRDEPRRDPPAQTRRGDREQQLTEDEAPQEDNELRL